MGVQGADEQSIGDLVRSAQVTIDCAAARGVATLSHDELPEVLSEVAVLEAKTAAMRLALLAEADARELARQLAETGTMPGRRG